MEIQHDGGQLLKVSESTVLVRRDIEQSQMEMENSERKSTFSGDWDGMECDIKITAGHKTPIIHSGRK